MYQTIPYGRGMASNSWIHDGRPPSSSTSTAATTRSGGETMKRMVAENPVVVVGRRDCCLCHVVKRLLQGHGVNPVVCEVGDDVNEATLMEEVRGGADPLQNSVAIFPAVFIGGRLVGGLDRLMAAHISGDLVPILKEAGALWL